jgi:hypothetical protein
MNVLQEHRRNVATLDNRMGDRWNYVHRHVVMATKGAMDVDIFYGEGCKPY